MVTDEVSGKGQCLRMKEDWSQLPKCSESVQGWEDVVNYSKWGEAGREAAM